MNKVNIYGKDYYFCYNVKATAEISKLCTGGSIQNLQSDLEKMNEAEILEFISKMAVIMNKAANMKRRFENDININEHFDEINEDMLMSLDVDTFTEKVKYNIFATMNEDSETTIEVEDDPKNAEEQPTVYN